jgi:hypothetical protein
VDRKVTTLSVQDMETLALAVEKLKAENGM